MAAGSATEPLAVELKDEYPGRVVTMLFNTEAFGFHKLVIVLQCNMLCY